MSDFDYFDYDDDDGDVDCFACGCEADFYCWGCQRPVCISHTVPVALKTYYCTECIEKVAV